MASRAASILGAVLVFVAFLAATEVSVRRWWQTPATVVQDPRFGLRPEPHRRYIFHTEGYSVRATNAFGFFSPDTLSPRPRARVLLLGDSFAEALQMPESQTFASVAQRELSGVEIVNAGQSGRSPYYYAATLVAFERTFHPDVVVIQVNDGDLDEVGQPEIGERTLAELRDCARAARAAGGDSTHPAGVRERGAFRRLLHEFVLGKFLYDRVTLLQLQEHNRWQRKWHGAIENVYERTGAIPPGVPARLDSLFAVMHAANPHLVFVYMPHVDYFDGPARLTYPGRREFYREFAARHGVPLVDPSDELLAEFRRTGQPLHGFANSEIGTGHMNALGHAVIGRELADALRAER